MFEFRFYTSQNLKLNYNQPNLSVNITDNLYNVLEGYEVTCPRIKPLDFGFQYSYYITEEKDVIVFSIYLSETLTVNVSYYGAIGIFINKLLSLHYPKAVGSHICIYLPNFASPTSKVVKCAYRVDCIHDFTLSLDGYIIELK